MPEPFDGGRYKALEKELRSMFHQIDVFGRICETQSGHEMIYTMASLVRHNPTLFDRLASRPGGWIEQIHNARMGTPTSPRNSKQGLACEVIHIHPGAAVD